jgi:Tfp pilus assembly protein PilN
MPANQITINLLNQEGSVNSPWNRIMIWITTYGRYIMITTELIVLLAFASRFSLDRKLTDLKENISQKQEILEVNVELEKDIREVQDKLALVSSLLKDQSGPIDTLILVQTLMPTGTYLDTLSIEKNKLHSSITADSSDNFTSLLTNFSVSKNLSGVEIGKVGKQLSGIQFTLSANIQPSKNVK